MIFGDRVTELREKLMLTQEELASSIGVSVNTVDNWEHGLTSPQKSNLQALAKILQTTAGYLEGDSEISSKPRADTPSFSYGEEARNLFLVFR